MARSCCRFRAARSCSTRWNDTATPLPPYIARDAGATASDDEDYQTVYAARRGAVAAPTRWLHFTDRLMDAVRNTGVGSSL